MANVSKREDKSKTKKLRPNLQETFSNISTKCFGKPGLRNKDVLLRNISKKQIGDLDEIVEIQTRRSNKHYIHNDHSRSLAFNKRKNGIIKKAFELAVTTKSQILFMCAPENEKKKKKEGGAVNNVYTFSTHKFKPLIKDFKDIISIYLQKKEFYHPEQREFFGLKKIKNEDNTSSQDMKNNNFY